MTTPALVTPPPAEDAAPQRGGITHLAQGSLWLIVSLATWALGAFLFWLIAARVADPDAVGRASALFSSLLAVVALTGLGLPVTLSRFARTEADDADGLFAWAVATSTAFAAIGATVFFVVAPESLTAPLTDHGPVAAWFVYTGAVAGTAIAALTDVRLMTLRRWRWVFIRVAAVNVTRIVFLIAAPADDAFVLFLLAALIPAASGAAAAGVLQCVGVGGRLLPLPSSLRPAARYTAVNYVGDLAIHAPLMVLPVIVLLSVEPSVNAAFYIAWSVAAVVFLVPQAIAQALLVEGGRDGSSLSSQVRAALAAGLALTVVASVGARVFDHAVVWAYGSDYEATARLLPSLVGASIAWVFTSIALAHARVRKAGGSVLLITGVFAVTVLLPAAFATPVHGIDGAARAWLLGNIATSLVATFVLTRALGWRALATGDRRGSSIPEATAMALASPPTGS